MEICRPILGDDLQELHRQLPLLRVLLRYEALQRGEADLFGGLWSLPSGPGETRAQAGALARELGLRGSLAARAQGPLRHVLTHRILTVRLFVLEGAAGPRSSALKPVHPTELAQLGTSTLTRKLLALSAR